MDILKDNGLKSGRSIQCNLANNIIIYPSGPHPAPTPYHHQYSQLQETFGPHKTCSNIKTSDPILNRTDIATKYSKLRDHIIPKIAYT